MTAPRRERAVPRWAIGCQQETTPNQNLLGLPAEYLCSAFNSRMKLSDKVKIALEETRILILGAQILLGFGFRGVFDDRFDQLLPYARYVDGVGLGLLVCAIALLIAPGPYHRIVEAGQDSGRLHRFTTFIADLALLPFALALGIGFLSARRGFLTIAPSRSRRAR